MAKKIVWFLALAGAALSTVGTQAAPATQTEADRLRGVFERYLGHPAPGETGSVRVTPEGETYRIGIDLGQLMKPLGSFGLALEPATSTMVATPNENGTWHVTGDAMPPLVLHFKAQTIAMNTSTARFEGTFDPKIPGFSTQTGSVDGWTVEQDAPNVTEHRRTGHVSWSQTAAAEDAGSASTAAKYTFSDLTDQMVLRAPKPEASVEVAPSAPPVEFSYAIPSGSAEIAIDRLRLNNLLDLWAFFIAHPNHDAIVAGQDELRGLLRAALPLMSSGRESGTFDGVTVTTQMGAFSTRTVTGSMEFADLAGAGSATMAVKIDGLTVPSTDLPLWSVGLIPTSIEIKPSVTGFHFDDAAKEAVEDFDLKADGFTPAQRERIAQIAWPGKGHVTLAPSRITSGLLDLKLEGEAAVGGPVPVGHLTITGTGVDKVIASLQQAVATDSSAAQVLAQFVALKNLAKPNPDGSLTWDLEATADSGLTVNGASLK